MKMEMIVLSAVLVLFAWFVVVITSFLMKREREAAKLLDCVLTLANAEKAKQLTQAELARERMRYAQKNPELAKATQERARERVTAEAAWEEVSKTGTITREQEEALNAN